MLLTHWSGARRAAGVFLTLLACIVHQSIGRGEDTRRPDGPPPRLAAPASPVPPAFALASTTRPTPLSVRLVNCVSVVRGKMVEITQKHVQFRVSKVLYGADPGAMLCVPCIPDFATARGRLSTARRFDGTTGPYDPSDAEVWEHVLTMNRFQQGREAVLLLYDNRYTEVNPTYRWHGTWTDSLRCPLDRYEKQVLKILEAGTHLTPPEHPDDLTVYIQLSERIVRARLAAIDDESVQWEITGKAWYPWPVAGVGPQPSKPDAEPGSKTVAFSLQPWRIRAEAIARRKLSLTPGQSPPRERVQRELCRLIAEELPAGQEALLFLRRLRKDDLHKKPHPLAGIVYTDCTRPRYLDHLESEVAEIIEKGRHNIVY